MPFLNQERSLCHILKFLGEYEKKLEEKERNKEPTAQEVENERLKAQIFFSNWARATKKQFQKEG